MKSKNRNQKSISLLGAFAALALLVSTASPALAAPPADSPSSSTPAESSEAPSAPAATPSPAPSNSAPAPAPAPAPAEQNPPSVVLPSGQVVLKPSDAGSVMGSGSRPAAVDEGLQARFGAGQLDAPQAAAAAGGKPSGTESMPGGVDVSGWQQNVNWQNVWNQGARFAFVKASEGPWTMNDYFAQQYNGSANIGMIRGAYHFARPNLSSGASQAQVFVQSGGGWSGDGKTLPGVLDLEYNNGNDGANKCFNMSAAQITSWTADFFANYKALTGRDAIIYTSYYFWQDCMGSTSAFSQTNPLWIAAYGASLGNLLMPGKWPQFTFWQFSDSGPYNGGDSNVFNGDANGLSKMAYGRTSSPSIRSAADLLTIDSSGALWNYTAGDGKISGQRIIGSGWSDAASVHSVDWNNDGTFDLLAQFKDGTLRVYFGSQSGGFTGGTQVGVGWQGLKITVSRLNRSDRFTSVLATDNRGQLTRYSTNSGIALDGGSAVLGSGYFGTTLTATDFNSDGSTDLLVKKPDGSLYLSTQDASGRFTLASNAVGVGWNDANSLVAVSGFSSVGSLGIIARFSSTGDLRYYSLTGQSSWGSSWGVGTGFGNLLMGSSQPAGELPGPSISKSADILALDPSGSLWNSQALISGALAPRKQIGWGFSGVKSLTTVDWNQDGILDLFVQWNSGSLSVYPGLPAGGFRNPMTVGTAGWADLKISVGKWGNSSFPSVLAIDGNGNLLRYDNLGGSSYLSSKGQIGNGWNKLRTTMMDWNGDGINDLVYIDGQGTMRVYQGTAQGGFQPQVPPVVGTGWGNLDPVNTSYNLIGNGTSGLLARTSNGSLLLYSTSGTGKFSGSQVIPGSWSSVAIANTAAGS